METNAALAIPDSWTPSERWAWSEILAGRPADFDKRYGASLDPDTPSDWDRADADRRLSPECLEMILKAPFATSLQTTDISIVGAWIPGDVRLTTVPRNMTLEMSRIDGSVRAFSASVRLTVRAALMGVPSSRHGAAAAGR